MLVLDCLGLRLVLWCENPFARFGGTKHTRPKSSMGQCLGLHYGLDCEDGVQYPACGKRACVRACERRCVEVWLKSR